MLRDPSIHSPLMSLHNPANTWHPMAVVFCHARWECHVQEDEWTLKTCVDHLFVQCIPQMLHPCRVPLYKYTDPLGMLLVASGKTQCGATVFARTGLFIAAAVPSGTIPAQFWRILVVTECQCLNKNNHGGSRTYAQKST